MSKDSLKIHCSSENRVPYNEASNNGRIFANNYYIPEELLMDIFLNYIDYETLRKCQMVCKNWSLVIRRYVWKKKAERIICHSLPNDTNVPWTSYYKICHRKPFNKNLIKNPSGQNCLPIGWITEAGIFHKDDFVCNDDNVETDYANFGTSGWKIECPPVGAPKLPDDPVFDGKQYCFVTSYEAISKEQTIDLLKEGFSDYILDNLQPTIKVSEWYCARFDCPSEYSCRVELMDNNASVIDSYHHHDEMRGPNQNQWIKFQHEFKNYGKGLRKIRFFHGGNDLNWWSGHYGSKMAGACVIVL